MRGEIAFPAAKKVALSRLRQTIYFVGVQPSTTPAKRQRLDRESSASQLGRFRHPS
jgi:hypothetical protein